MNKFFKVMLMVVALAMLGPPALGLLAGLLGLTFGLLAVGLKLGVIALAVYAMVLLSRAVFGGGPVPRALPKPDRGPAIDQVFDELEQRRDAEMAALDRELQQVLVNQASGRS